MKNIELKINVQYLQLDELPKDEQELVAADTPISGSVQPCC